MFLLILIPGTPKDLLGYFAPLTGMSPWTWLFITSVARIPSIITSTIGGSALGVQNYVFAAIALGATLLISGAGLLIYRRSCRAHEEHAKRRTTAMPDKLLIADDEPDIVDTLARCFASRGYEILRASSGEEAVRQAGRAPDLILLDVNMPDLDGLEVCRRIRQHVACPIIFLTARVEESDKAPRLCRRRGRLRRQALLARRAGRPRGRAPEARAPPRLGLRAAL